MSDDKKSVLVQMRVNSDLVDRVNGMAETYQTSRSAVFRDGARFLLDYEMMMGNGFNLEYVDKKNPDIRIRVKIIPYGMG